MLGVALMIDFLQIVIGFIALIPILGLILAVLLGAFVSIAAWMAFYFWFTLLGVSFFKRADAKAAVWFTGALLEITPLGILPLWTATIAATIALVRIEDKV